MNWAEEYNSLSARLDGIVADARLTLCGLSACVDATVSLHDAMPVLESADRPKAASLANALAARAKAGVGGEMRVDWPEGPSWLDRHLPLRHALGGTGPHAARVLAHLGAPALLALSTRSPEQMRVLDDAICLAQDGRSTRARHVRVEAPNATKIYIFEFSAGRPLRDAVLARSSRIIVRFNDPGLEDDAEFAALSVRLAPEAGAGILSGFNAIGGGDLQSALASTRALVAHWRRESPIVVHLELAGYDRDELRDQALDGLVGAMTSLGQSHSEFQALTGCLGHPADAMLALAKRFKLDRVCVHADSWAATVTNGDPRDEREALLTGCLLASTRAASGRVSRPTGVPDGALFETPPGPSRLEGMHFVAVSAPFLKEPATTLGLGDTFMAGCLLVLGGLGRRLPAASDRRREQVA